MGSSRGKEEGLQLYKLIGKKDQGSQDPRRSLVTKQKVQEHANMQFEEVLLSENVHGLEANSKVEITNKNDDKLYGVLRWMGHNTRLGSMAGIELEEKLPSGGTDGMLFGNRFFKCESGRAIFVKLSTVMPDSRFPSQTQTFTKTKRLTSQDLQKVQEHPYMQFEEVPLPENVHGLEPSSRVEITNKNDDKLYGVLRWMGNNTILGSMAGMELEEKLPSGGTDGKLFGNQVFKCESGRAIFVKISTVMPDSRFPSQTQTFTKTKRLTSQETMCSSPESPNTSQTKSKGVASKPLVKRSFTESDLKNDMDVYVSTKKGSKEEYVKGKILYIGKPRGEIITYVGVELEKPRISPWDGTFKSHRLCQPKSPWYSELVPINDIVPAEFLEGQGNGDVHANSSSSYPIKTITGQIINTPLTHLAGSNDGSRGKGQDIHLKVQEQLFDNAMKTKDAGGQSGGGATGLRKFSRDFMNKLQSLGGNKETSLQAELPPLGAELIEEICIKVDQAWGFLAHYLEVDQNRIEKISGKTSNSYDRVILTLVHWWKRVHKQPQAIQTLAFALSQLGHEKLAGRVLVAVAETEMDTEVLDIVATRTYSTWKRLASELGLEAETIEEIDKTGSPLYKDSARRMLDVWDREISIGCEKLSLLVRACRHSGHAELANELEQGLDTDRLERISRMVDGTRWRPFGEALGFPAEHLTALENSINIVKLRVYTMLGSWRNTQPFSSDKIMAISSALDYCGLPQLAWEICRGLDEDLLFDLAIKLQKDWRRLGTWLHLPNPEMSKLATSYSDESRQALQVLVMWRKRQHASCDLLGELAKVLRETEHRGISDWLVQGIHDEVLDKLASLIKGEWKELAQHLGFDKADIAVIRDGNKLEAQRIYKMLCQWRYRQHYKTDRVQVLAEGLAKCGLASVADVVLGNKGDEAPSPNYASKSRGKDTNLSERTRSPSEHKESPTVNEDDLLEIAAKIGDRWKRVAYDLGFTQFEILDFEKKYPSIAESCYYMLQNWKEKLLPGNSGRKDLERALQRCGHKNLIAKLWHDQRALCIDIDHSDEPNASMSREPRGTVPHGNVSPREVDKEMMLSVAGVVVFEALVKILPLMPSDIEVIKRNYQRMDQRCFQALDAWVRHGPGGKRYVSELVQVMSNMGRIDIVKFINSKAAKRHGLSPTAAPSPRNVSNERQTGRENTIEFSTVVPVENNLLKLAINSKVEVLGGTKKLYGVLKWMGHSPVSGTMAGIELKETLGRGGTDGLLLGKRYFQCEANKGLFVKLHNVKPDSRCSPSAGASGGSSGKEFGGFHCPSVKGYVQPPVKLIPELIGHRKGIQGFQLSGYLDSVLYSMFAYSNSFDKALLEPKAIQDAMDYESVQKILREDIVNPLRSYGFVRADKVMQFRGYLDKLCRSQGWSSKEKDPEEFLDALLQEILQVQPYLEIRQGQQKHVGQSYHYQIFMEKNESLELPTVEQLLHHSFLQSDLKLAKVPPCLIVQMPRFGKDYRMYNRIFPSPYLDISDILEGWPQLCSVCGKRAEFKCTDCSGQDVCGTTISSFCGECYGSVHQFRPNHKFLPLKLSQDFQQQIGAAIRQGMTDDALYKSIICPRKTMELFAVVCIDTSYYVAFVKAGTGADAKWVFFDSMADRGGEQHGYNIPEVTHLKDFNRWLDDPASLQGCGSHEIPAHVRRLLSDVYMCMYQDPKLVQGNFRGLQTTTDMEEMMRTLRLVDQEASGTRYGTLDRAEGFSVPAFGNPSPEGASSSTGTDSRTEQSSAETGNSSRLQAQVENLERKLECMICMDRQKDTMFQCGHSMCKTCAEQLRDCPVCKQKIEMMIPMFM